MSNVAKDLAVLGIKASLATAPFCGGIAEIFGWAVEGRFVDRRLAEIESLLGKDSDIFLQNLKELNEHDYYAIKKLLKFHCFEAFPELTHTTAKAIIDYAMNRQNRIGDDQIIEKGTGDYTKIVEWKDISPFRRSDPDGKFKMSNMVLSTFENEDGSVTPEISEGINALAISYSKLNRLKIICAYHQIYPGMNSDFDIDQFTITPFGVKILEFIDYDDV